jgi:uncharacterized protein DUF3175
MERSGALDLEEGVFTKRSAKAIAESLKRSADRSKRRKTGPFASAMAMLNFHINRSGKNLTESRRQTLERAKNELRKLYGREPKRATRARRPARRRATSRARRSR